jgi:serine/threonine protein kinase/Flp pilus assembly protein TadD
MNQIEDRPQAEPPCSAPAVDDGLVVRAVREYLELVDAGQKPDHRAFAARYPDIAEALAECLGGLDFVRAAVPELSRGDVDPEAAAGDADVAPPGGTLGDFRILRQVGRGGMGVVYEAEQVSLGRRVALKVLPFAGALDPRRLQRFKNEAQAAAHLQHQNIVPVYFVGCDRGVHYYAMQFIDGRTLAEVIDELRRERGLGDRPAPEATTPYSPESPPSQPGREGMTADAGARQTRAEQAHRAETLPGSATPGSGVSRAAYFRWVARLGEQAAEALEHAHQLGVVHRDVKPANLLLDGRGNLWVTDFGLAQFQAGGQLTMTGDLVGTLRYMSPEQALAKRVAIDHRTDVYSLGVTLYELLTLRPAFAGQDRQELLRQIAFEEPRRPRRWDRGVPAELETIVLKALAKNPDERYATAQELAEDLRHFLEDKPIRARRPGLVKRLRKWARRHRAMVGAAAVVICVAAVLAGVNGLWWLQQRAVAEADARLAIAEAVQFCQEERWPEGLSATRRAQAALAGVGADSALRRQADELARDVEMGQRLEGARVRPAIDRDPGAADAAYADAFRWYGLDVDHVDPAEAAERIRASAIAGQLVAALDGWALVGPPGPDRKRTIRLAIARAADPDVLRNLLRDAFEGKERDAFEGKELGALRRLVALRDDEDVPPATAVHLANLVRAHPAARPWAILLLRHVWQRHPADFWVNYELGYAYLSSQPPQVEEGIRFCTAAVILRPRSPGAHINLGVALRDRGRLDEAIAEYRAAILLNDHEAVAHINLGGALAAQGHADEAIQEFRTAVQLNADNADAHYNLGLALRTRRLGEAIEEFRAAIRRRKGFGEAQGLLGISLRDQGRVDQAITELRQVIRMNGDTPQARCELGMLLCDYKRDYGGAIEQFQAGLRLDKDNAGLHDNLGVALKGKGRVEQAIKEHCAAIRIDKNYGQAHYNLANDLAGLGRYEQAVAEYREAIRCNKDHAEAHCNVGILLARQMGQFREALEQLCCGHALGSRNPHWPYPSREWIREAELMARLDARLPALLARQAKTTDAGELLGLGRLCQLPCKRLYAAAARFYADAFTTQPKLAADLNAGNRYNAARGAARAGTGHGQDSAGLDAGASARLRRQALDWLRADLALYAGLATQGSAQCRAVVQERLAHWQQDSDFSGVRGEALARLPAGERDGWRKLWSDAEQLLAGARSADNEGGKPDTKRPPTAEHRTGP